MAVTTQNSTEYGNSIATPPTIQDAQVLAGKVRIAYFSHTQSGAGDSGSSAAVVKLPPGKVRMLGRMSEAYVNWTTAAATLDVGWDAYTNIDGTAVAADVDGIDDGISVEVAGFQVFGTALTANGGDKVFESRDGVVLRLTSASTAIIAGNVAVGHIAYVVE